MKPVPPVTRMRRAAHVRCSPAARISSQRPGRVRALSRIEQALHAIALGEAGRGGGRCSMASRKRLASRDTGAMRRSRELGRGSILDRDRLQRAIRRGRACMQRKAAHVVRGRIGQDQRAVVAIELEAMAAAEKRRAAHRQAAAGARRRKPGERNARTARSSRQAGQPRRTGRAIGPQNHSRLCKQWLTKLPRRPPPPSRRVFQFFKPQPRRRVLDIPGHGDMAQPADRAAVEHGLGLLPRRQLGKLKSMMVGRPPCAPFAAWLRPPARSAAIGFSTNTGLPSSSARRAIAGCRSGGTAMPPPRRRALDQRAQSPNPREHSPHAPARPCARRRCPPAPPPGSAGRCGMRAVGPCVHNCSRRCPLRAWRCPHCGAAGSRRGRVTARTFTAFRFPASASPADITS